ncbi:Trp biosynthesis-associated membrane protein [Leucobacter sp. HY1910]
MRAKPLTLGVIAIAGAVALGAGSQPWIEIALEGGAAETPSGYDLNAALSPVAIAVVAAALALSIAGPVFRRVLGVLVAGLGAGITALSVTAASDPVQAMTARVTELTGLAGHAGLASVLDYSLTPWSFVTAGAGVLAACAGIVVIFVSGRWAVAGRKYEASPAKDPEASRDRISDWDSLSEGEDPTEAESDASDAPDTNRD